MKGILVVLANLLLFGCSGPEKHNGTTKICDGKLFVEISTEWSEMGVIYLTDSLNFRIKVDRFNFESEYHKYYCKSETIIIEKWLKDELNPKHILTTKTFKIKKLIEEGKFEK